MESPVTSEIKRRNPVSFSVLIGETITEWNYGNIHVEMFNYNGGKISGEHSYLVVTLKTKSGREFTITSNCGEPTLSEIVLVKPLTT